PSPARRARADLQERARDRRPGALGGGDGAGRLAPGRAAPAHGSGDWALPRARLRGRGRPAHGRALRLDCAAPGRGARSLSGCRPPGAPLPHRLDPSQPHPSLRPLTTRGPRLTLASIRPAAPPPTSHERRPRVTRATRPSGIPAGTLYSTRRTEA